jgi:ABC-2 type transport system ATP-binding protein/lipopolysaccharide transport system ATP-binding protein
MARVLLENLSITFPVYEANARSLKNSVLALTTGGRIGTEQDRIFVRALDDVSLAFEHGDRVALIGRNGAGKTTLLRVLAGIYEPFTGRLLTEGRVAPTFDPMLGMEMESTGYENIFLRGMFLGLRRKEIEVKAKEIAEFADLGDYLSMPVRTYSSGMAMRLAFAVATCIDPDILLMDEWLSAGDASFVAKAQKRLADFVDQASILVLASHSTDLLRSTCNKGVLLEHGRVVAFGFIEDVLAAYGGAP